MIAVLTRLLVIRPRRNILPTQGFRCPRSRAAKPEANAGPGPPNASASLKRDGPDGTVIWTPGNIFKSDDRHSPT
jgi:hypothetical protein